MRSLSSCSREEGFAFEALLLPARGRRNDAMREKGHALVRAQAMIAVLHGDRARKLRHAAVLHMAIQVRRNEKSDGLSRGAVACRPRACARIFARRRLLESHGTHITDITLSGLPLLPFFAAALSSLSLDLLARSPPPLPPSLLSFPSFLFFFAISRSQ